MVYLVICEIGEYSDFDVDIMYYFSIKSEAHEMKEQLEKEQEIQNEIDRYLGEPVRKVDYLVVDVQHGPFVFPDERKKQRIAALQKSLEDAKAWRKKNDEDMAMKRTQQEQQLMKEHEFELEQFKQWWEGGFALDPFFAEKRSAKFRSVHKHMEWYMQHGNNQELKQLCESVLPLIADARKNKMFANSQYVI